MNPTHLTEAPADDDPKGVYVPRRFALPRYIGGIDPDTDKSGLVIFDRDERRFVLLTCLTMPDLQARLLTYAPDEILIIVEAGWLNGGLFHGKDTTNWNNPKAVRAYTAAIAKQVGKNFNVGQGILHFLKVNQYQVEEYRPAGKKWRADFFKRCTGLAKGYNPEIRDAVRAMFHHIQDKIQ